MCALITRVYGSADTPSGATILGVHFNTDLTAIFNEFNGNIDNTNIKSGAVIDPAKLDPAKNIVLNNAVIYQAKNSAGTAKDLIKLGTDDFLHISQVQEKALAVTTNRVDQVICRGFDYVTGTGASSATKAITLPVTYDSADAYDVQVAIIGAKALGNPTARSNSTTNYTASTIRVVGNTMTSSAFTVEVSLFTGNITATDTILFSYICIGTKT